MEGPIIYVLICLPTDPEYETIAEPALVIPLQLDEAVGAEGLLVGRLLNELLALPCGGSLRGKGAFKCYLA